MRCRHGANGPVTEKENHTKVGQGMRSIEKV